MDTVIMSGLLVILLVASYMLQGEEENEGGEKESQRFNEHA